MEIKKQLKKADNKIVDFMADKTEFLDKYMEWVPANVFLIIFLWMEIMINIILFTGGWK